MESHPVEVVLTVAHLDHQPENSDPVNLRAGQGGLFLVLLALLVLMAAPGCVLLDVFTRAGTLSVGGGAAAGAAAGSLFGGPGAIVGAAAGAVAGLAQVPDPRPPVTGLWDLLGRMVEQLGAVGQILAVVLAVAAAVGVWRMASGVTRGAMRRIASSRGD